MQINNREDLRICDPRIATFPALVTLGLTTGDMKELASQGFVSQERRGPRTYYKLRYRRGGKQVVRYIGSADRAATVNNELAILQAETKRTRDLKTIVRNASQLLRESKRTIEPMLHANGYVFHGLAIRRPRRRQIAKTTNSST